MDRGDCAESNSNYNKCNNLQALDGREGRGGTDWKSNSKTEGGTSPHIFLNIILLISWFIKYEMNYKPHFHKDLEGKWRIWNLTLSK